MTQRTLKKKTTVQYNHIERLVKVKIIIPHCHQLKHGPYFSEMMEEDKRDVPSFMGGSRAVSFVAPNAVWLQSKRTFPATKRIVLPQTKNSLCTSKIITQKKSVRC